MFEVSLDKRSSLQAVIFEMSLSRDFTTAKGQAKKYFSKSNIFGRVQNYWNSLKCLEKKNLYRGESGV